jgi:tRNA (guanine-N7-)-methyltransferase
MRVQSETCTKPGPTQATEQAASHPHIRSFVRRQGKITASQRQARSNFAAKWSLSFTGQPLCLSDLFGNENPVVLEIGFGMGETTAIIAARNPSWNFLGLEVYPAGVGALLQRIEKQAIENIRIIEHDAVEVLKDGLEAESLHGIHLFFPDPWPKKRHHKRRLIQPAVAQLMASRIEVGGYLHCATDWQPYADQMLSVLSTEPLLENRFQGFAPRPNWRPQTKFEARGLRLGQPAADLVFMRRPSPASPSATSG